jgi:hypothetical protein
MSFRHVIVTLPTSLWPVSPILPLAWKFVLDFVPQNMVKLITKY